MKKKAKKKDDEDFKDLFKIKSEEEAEKLLSAIIDLSVEAMSKKEKAKLAKDGRKAVDGALEQYEQEKIMRKNW